LHNGSHAIDLANYLFGKVLSACVLSGRADFYRDDPSLNAYLSYKNCRDVFLLAGDERQYSLFEFDITGQKGRICFEQCGLRYTEYTVRSDPVYAGYRDLKKGVTHKTGLDKSLLNLVTNAVNHIERNEKIACSGDDALRAQEICSALLKDHFGGIKKCSNRQIKFFLL
jgi:predicted dehydrogenase